ALRILSARLPFPRGGEGAGGARPRTHRGPGNTARKGIRMTPILEFHNIERSFRKGVPVLNGVTFSMGEGEVLGLLGRNGSGKTTLIRIAMGMLFPQAGTVRVFGLSPTDDPVAVKKRIGYVAEEQRSEEHTSELQSL